jgi:hypothetical protein
MMMRIVALMTLVCVCTATSCAKITGIAIAPSPTSDSAGVADKAFRLLERVTGRRGMQAYVDPYQGQDAWIKCFAQSLEHGRKFVLCGKLKDHELQLRLFEDETVSFTPRADSMRRELLDSLRAEFGEQAVRECVWRIDRDPQRSGCPSVAQRTNDKARFVGRTVGISAEL